MENMRQADPANPQKGLPAETELRRRERELENLANTIATQGTRYDEIVANIVDIEDKQHFFEDLLYKECYEAVDINNKPVFPSESLRSMHVRMAKHKHTEWITLENLRISLDSERRAIARTLEKLNNLFKIKTAVLKSL